jgi:hypothetical protein
MLNWIKRLLRRGESPASPEIKAPVKVTVTARRVRADGSLGEEIAVKNVEVKPWPQS